MPAHVRAHRDRIPSALRYPVHRALRRREVEIGGHDAGALFRESQRDSPAVAGAGAGNYGNAIFESHDAVLPARTVRGLSTSSPKAGIVPSAIGRVLPAEKQRG